MDVVDRNADRQRVESLLPGTRVGPHRQGEHIRIEQVRKGTNGVCEVHEPIVEGPLSDVVLQQMAEGEVRRPPRRDCAPAALA